MVHLFYILIASFLRSYRSPNTTNPPHPLLFHETSQAGISSKAQYPQAIAELESFPPHPRLCQNHHPNNFVSAILPLHILQSCPHLIEYQQRLGALQTTIRSLGITLPARLVAQLAETYVGATPLDQYVAEESCWVAVLYDVEI